MLTLGARLVGAALNAYWAARLNPVERLVLVTMAHTAHDTANGNGHAAGEYWGGHDVLMATVLGDIPNPGTTEYNNAKKLIQRAVATLIEAGAIERTAAAHRGRQARYKVVLNVSQPALPVDNS